MTDVDFVNRVHAHPAYQARSAALDIGGRLLADLFINEMSELFDEMAASLSGDQAKLYDKMSFEQQRILIDQLYNQRSEEGKTLTAALLPLIEAARGGAAGSSEGRKPKTRPRRGGAKSKPVTADEW